MKRLWIMMTGLLLCIGSIQAQSQKEERAQIREQRRAEQEALDSLLYEQSQKALKAKEYVLEADRVIFKRGTTAYVSSNTNFIAVENDRATVQIAFNIPVSGPNGIGGITVEGLMSNYKQQTDKKGNTHISFNVMGTGISARIDINQAKGSDRATVNISPNFNSERLTLEGHILPLQQSSIYKGRAL